MKRKNHLHTLHVLIGCAIVAFSLLLPAPGTLSRSAMYLLGVFAATVYLWMTVDVSWPSVACIVAMGLLPETTMSAVIAGSIGNQTVSFLIFTFCCSWALEQTQFVRRCAIRFLNVPFAAGRPWIFLMLYFASILLLGSFMSTTVIVIIYLTINEEIFAILGLKKGDKVASLMTMGLIIVSGISGAITPIAHVFPLMAISLYEKAAEGTISYLHYMLSAVPVGILVTLIMLAVFKLLLRPDVSCLKELDVTSVYHSLKPADRKEKITVTVFLGICALWILPELVSGIFPGFASLVKSYGTVLPPMLGTVLLCVITVDGAPVMNLKKALSSIPWLSVFMGASALALGSQMSSESIGLTSAISNALSPMLTNIPPLVFVAVMVFFTGFLTNVASNMVIVTLACTIAIPIASAMEPAINTAALCAVIGATSAYAFATPPAMTTVALGIASGWTTTKELAKFGFLVLTLACLLLTFVSYPIAAAWM